jgi:serine/threonine protein kinase
MSLVVGVRLGVYEVVGTLGEGGMGEVYRASDTRLQRDVALKILPEAFARDPDRLARFEREARVLASLNHPNIAQIFGLEESSDVKALVLELVAGDDLSPSSRAGRCRSPRRLQSPGRSPRPWKQRTRRASSIAISSPPM